MLFSRALRHARAELRVHSELVHCRFISGIPEDSVIFTDSAPSHDNLLVLILGWGGSKRAHLRRVLEFYEGRGVPTVSHIMPLYASEGERLDYTEKIYSAIEQNRAHRTVAAHIFSNNGTWSYARLLMMHESNRKNGESTSGCEMPLVDLCVYDSAPGVWREPLSIFAYASMFGRAILPSILGRPQYYHPFYSPALTAYLMARITAERVGKKVALIGSGEAEVSDFNVIMNNYLYDRSPPVPHLFLYSEGDMLITADLVEDFASEVENRGAPIEKLRWGSEVVHCAGMLTKPEEYTEKLSEFLGLSSK